MNIRNTKDLYLLSLENNLNNIFLEIEKAVKCGNVYIENVKILPENKQALEMLGFKIYQDTKAQTISWSKGN